MNQYGHMSFTSLIQELCDDLLKAPTVEQETWHAQDVTSNPLLVANELMHFVWENHIPDNLEQLVAKVQPSLPWAEDHFQERVGRQPLNPPPSEQWWPHAVQGNAVHKDADEKFSHTYPERMWPCFDPERPGDPERRGIRFAYGDLDDVVRLLVKEPTTRQAYLPIWFPEDTGATEGQRLPCSLGYHFMIRGGYLHCTYSMRSCDFVRHFRDDIYMAMRLTQWVTREVVGMMVRNDPGGNDSGALLPGTLMVHIASLHAFKGDHLKLREKRV